MEEKAAPPLRALMLAFEWPPLAAGGVHRALKLAKYLPREGIELDVVTVREEDYRAWSAAPFDATLGRDLPTTVRVHRISSGFPYWYWRLVASRLGFRLGLLLYWGDPVSVFWRGPLLAFLDRLVADRKPEVLLVTVPPFGLVALGRTVARRYRLPWVMDWRDAWTLWSIAPFASFLHYWYARTTEERSLREANVSVVTSHVTRDDWLDEFERLDAARLRTIYNGYDRDDVAHLSASPVRAPDGKRRIAYVGSFYYTPVARARMLRPLWKRAPHQWLHYRKRPEDWLYRSPYFFLRGLRRFVDQHPSLAARVEVVLAGVTPEWLRDMLQETRTQDLVVLRGVVPHAECLALQAGADALLLTSAKVENGRDYSIAGKTFEYMGLRRPILGILTDGAMRDLVVQSGLGILADPDDTDAVAAAIHRVVMAADSTQLVRPDEALIDRFDRRSVAASMAEALHDAAREGYRESGPRLRATR